MGYVIDFGLSLNMQYFVNEIIVNEIIVNEILALPTKSPFTCQSEKTIIWTNSLIYKSKYKIVGVLPIRIV